MQLDYPEIINKLTLLLGAGMTVKRAWRKITVDYEEEKHIWGVRHAYEEMRQACNEMTAELQRQKVMSGLADGAVFRHIRSWGRYFLRICVKGQKD